MAETIFGIDLGTTNSAIAWVRDGRAEIIEYEGEAIMPSVVGRGGDGELLVGTPARNQLAVYPERTVASVKRHMASEQQLQLGDQSFSPEEIAAMILRELTRRAEIVTETTVRKVVITVPAFFRDSQRQATRAAGEIAGLEVVRIVNEPTAAALAFGGAESEERCLLVYDLGGGTFDTSIVRASGELVEVLASHGDVHLGGDDFDRLLADDLARRLREAGQDVPSSDRVLDARLLRAAEAAKIRLSEETRAPVREEFFGEIEGRAAHLDVAVERQMFEELIEPLVERSLDSIDAALTAAELGLADIDDVILVGGSTRVPAIARRLAELTGKAPRRDVHPDLCVALGAAILGARLGGVDAARVLVDVTPYSFGPSHLGEIDGRVSVDCYTPVIERGTPLPVTRSESYFTSVDGQRTWDVRIFQGESADARENILVGRFLAEGFADVPEGNEIVCKMGLDLDGILRIEVIEQTTGLSKHVTIEGAAAAWTSDKLAEARRRTAELWGEDPDDTMPAAPRDADVIDATDVAGEAPGWVRAAERVLSRGQALLERMAHEDRDEFQDLAADLRDAIHRSDADGGRAVLADLEDLVHYVEEA